MRERRKVLQNTNIRSIMSIDRKSTGREIAAMSDEEKIREKIINKLHEIHSVKFLWIVYDFIKKF